MFSSKYKQKVLRDVAPGARKIKITNKRKNDGFPEEAFRNFLFSFRQAASGFVLALNATAFKPLEVSEARHLKKGSLVNIEGRIKTSKYVDNKGVDRFSIEIIISRLEEIVRRNSEEGRA